MITIRLSETFRVTSENRESMLKDFSPFELTKTILENTPYELLQPICKLFFDYDEKSDDLIYIEKTRSEIRSLLLEHCGHYTNGFVFTESTSMPNKISFHVIFKKIIIVREHFQPEDEKELFETLVGKERFKHIDTQVYGKKLWFRVPYGINKDKPYPHIPIIPQGTKLILYDYMTTVSSDSSAKIYTSQINRQFQSFISKMNKEYPEDTDVPEDEKIKKMTEMVTLLHPERFKTYSLWCALMVLMKTHKLPRDLFIDISRASGYERFEESDCIRAWSQCNTNHSFGMSTLYGWLKQDGINTKLLFPTKSPILIILLNQLYKHGELSDLVVALALKETYNDKLYYTSTNGWLHYNETKWNSGDKTIIFAPIMKFISEDALHWIEVESKKNVTDESKKWFKLCKREIMSLQKVSKIEAVLKVAQGLFIDDTIIQTFDMKPNWFCFDDQKAYDMETKEIIMIQATDRIVTTCGYNMPVRIDTDIQVMENVLKTVVPPEEYKSFLSSLSIFMYGENINEVFVVWKGVGRNGKGLVHDALKTVLGNYFGVLSSEVLTAESKGANQATPELAHTQFIRCLMTSEPDDTAMIRKTKINLLTGRDPINARDLHKSTKTFVPKFTLAMMCNDIPKVSGGISEAIEKRMKIREFPYQFVKEVHYDFQRIAVESLKNKVKTEPFRNGFLYLLLDAWYECKGKYMSSKSAEEEQEAYVKENNPLSVFLFDYESSEKFVRIKVLHELYKKQHDVISSQKFKGLLIQAKVKIQEDKVHGTKIFLQKINKTITSED